MSAPNAAGRIDTHDIVEHNEAADLWDVILRQMSPGPFHGQVELVQLNGLLFYREHWNRRVIANGATPAGYFVFGGSVSLENSVDWCGGHVNQEQLAIGHPSSEMEIIFPDESNHISLLVPHHLLQHYFGEAFVTDTLSGSLHHLTCNLQCGCDLVPRLNRMITRYQANPALLADARECKAAEMQIINDLAAAFAGLDTKDNFTTRLRREKLHRAITYSQRLRGPITVPEFALGANASQRILEYAFRESLGVTPLQYLHLHRINRARVDLLGGDKGAITVSEVAEWWGFNELGRFAVEYKRLFGESPSVTLNRRKTSPASYLSNAYLG